MRNWSICHFQGWQEGRERADRLTDSLCVCGLSALLCPPLSALGKASDGQTNRLNDRPTGRRKKRKVDWSMEMQPVWQQEVNRSVSKKSTGVVGRTPPIVLCCHSGSFWDSQSGVFEPEWQHKSMGGVLPTTPVSF